MLCVLECFGSHVSFGTTKLWVLNHFGFSKKNWVLKVRWWLFLRRRLRCQTVVKLGNKVKSYLTSSSYFELVRVESGFQVGLEFDKQKTCRKYKIFSVKKVCGQWWGWRDEFFVFTVKILLLFRGKEATLVLVSSGKNLRPEFRSWWKNYGPVKKVFRLWPTFREQLFKMS